MKKILVHTYKNTDFIYDASTDELLSGAAKNIAKNFVDEVYDKQKETFEYIINYDGVIPNIDLILINFRDEDHDFRFQQVFTERL